MLNLPKLIGHRGVKNLSPENTIDSIEKAYVLGLKWVEVDVKISKDQIPILMHDDTLNRTTNGLGIPNNYNYIDLKKLDAGKFFYKYPTKIYIPTLEEILLYCNKKKIGINIEIKPNSGYEKANVNSIVSLLKKINFTNYYFSSFHLPSLIEIKKQIPNSNCGILVNEFKNDFKLEDIINICEKYNFFSCGFELDIVNYEIVKILKLHNLISTVYSSNNIKINSAKKLWSMGVQSIFIDDPTEYCIF